MSKPKKGTNLHIVTNSTDATAAIKKGTQVHSAILDGGYGQKPWGVLNGYVDRGESYLIEQAKSITKREMTGDEARLLFQFINIHSRLPFPECDLAAARLKRPSLFERLFGGGYKHGQPE